MNKSLVMLWVVVAACSPAVIPTTVEPATSTTSTSPTTMGSPTTSTADDFATVLMDRLASVDRLRDELIRIHPDPFWRIGEADFDAALDRLRLMAEDLTDDEFVVEIMRVGALIDGHTGARPSESWDVALIHLYRFADGVFVVDAEDPSMVGARLISVNGVPVEDAWSTVAPLASFDNPATVELVVPNFLRTPRIVAAVGLGGEAGAVRYTLDRGDGVEREYEPRTVTLTELREFFEGFAVGLPAVEGVGWLEHRDSAFWFDYRELDNMVYLQYNRVSQRGLDPVTNQRTSITGTAEAIAGLLEEHSEARLVIDLRHNPGGNNQTFGPLLALAEDKAATGECALAVLIGRQTFSAATNFATFLDVATPVRFYGEPTGGSPNLYGDAGPSSLSSVGVDLAISSRYWEIAGPDDDRIWIEPDVVAPISSAEFFAGIDPGMDAVVTDPICR